MDGLSPYFLTADQITALLQKHLLPKIKNFTPKNIFFYGTGLANPANAKVIKSVLKNLFAKAEIEVNHDLTAAMRQAKRDRLYIRNGCKRWLLQWQKKC